MYFIPFFFMPSTVPFPRTSVVKVHAPFRVGVKCFYYFLVTQAVLFFFFFLLITLLAINSSCYGSCRTKQWLRLSGNASVLKVTSGLCSLEGKRCGERNSNYSFTH